MILPEKAVLRASQWCYSGVWGLVTGWLQVPQEPPHLVGADDADVNAFRPAEGFLRYLKFFFWIGLVAFDGLMFIGWCILLYNYFTIGLILSPLIWAIMILPDIVAYIAIHLRYDTTWYVLSDRSMRIRRGIWIIHETTITYDNIQNVSIKQGPMQRHFGVADVTVETAGGGSSGEAGASAGHSGLLEGISNSEEVREKILEKWRTSKSSGLGDELHDTSPAATLPAFAPGDIQLLEEIHVLAQQLAARD